MWSKLFLWVLSKCCQTPQYKMLSNKKSASRISREALIY
nr:MAG TPA: hypothetical protein [Caudoviricetes sp.]